MMNFTQCMGMSIQDKVDIYETFTIPNLKRLIVKLAKDIPLTREEREMLKDIIMESNRLDQKPKTLADYTTQELLEELQKRETNGI